MSQHDFLFYDAIVRNAILNGSKEAFVDESTRLTYKEYLDLCNGYASGLLGQGTRVGDRIAVFSTNCCEFMILLGAAASIGAIMVPVNWRLKKEEIEYILEDCGPRFLFSSRDFCNLAEETSVNIGSVQKRYVLNSDDAIGDNDPIREIFSEEKLPVDAGCMPDNGLLIIYTAAVQGRPKGCLLTQSNFLAAGLQMNHLFRLKGDDCHICVLPLFHIGALSMVMAMLLEGGKTVIEERFDPERVVRLVDTEKGTFLGTFPPILASFLDAQESSGKALPSLRGIAGMDSPDNIQRFLKYNQKAVFYSLYGQTEAMPVSGGDYISNSGSIGPAAVLTRIRLCDDRGKEVSAGEVGEICVQSPSVFNGYWGLKGETEYTFRNGWHHTGDLGRMDENGFLWYEGRMPEKELIKSGGENVYPAEVEQVILSHGAVAEACVIGVPDKEWGEAVAAICVLQNGAVVSSQALRDFISSKIASYKKPKHFLFLKALFHTDNGRIDRVKIKDKYKGYVWRSGKQ